MACDSDPFSGGSFAQNPTVPTPQGRLLGNGRLCWQGREGGMEGRLGREEDVSPKGKKSEERMPEDESMGGWGADLAVDLDRALRAALRR